MTQLATIESALGHQPDAPIATSRDKRWSGVTVDIHDRVEKFELDAPPLDHHIVIYTPHGSARLTQIRAGRTHECVHRPGSVIIMPAGHQSSWRGTSMPTIRLRVPMRLIADAVQEIGTNSGQGAEVLNVFHTHDRFLAQLANVFQNELKEPEHPAQRLLIDSASSMVAIHLLRSHSPFGAKPQGMSQGLSPRALNRVIEYIEEHFSSAIRLDDLARLADVSRFHFGRMFKASTGHTPISFVERTRIDRAQALIRDGKLSLASIAINVGFSDQSHFTRRFQLRTDCTPGEYARLFAPRRLPSN